MSANALIIRRFDKILTENFEKCWIIFVRRSFAELNKGLSAR